MIKHKRAFPINGLLLLSLFTLFALGAIWVLTSGAGVYQRLSARSSQSYATRTASQYLATKVRQATAAEQVGFGLLGGHDTLILSETLDGVAYQTQIYCYDGYLRELFTAASAAPQPEDGEKILPAKDLIVTPIDAVSPLLKVQLQSVDGSWQEILLSPRGGVEALP